MKTRVSIIFLVFESYEMVRRQVLYMNSLNLPDSIEVIFTDDGSNPPVVLYEEPNFRYKMVYREKEEGEVWTIPKAINYGARAAKGAYLMFLGVDHILSPYLLPFFAKSNAGYAVFKRKYALIDRSGNLLKVQYKFKNEFLDCDCDYTSLGWIRRNHFVKLGGMDATLSGPTKHSADLSLFKRWCAMRGMTREQVIKRSERNGIRFYMLPEKKSTVLLKGRRGDCWHYMSHLRPIHHLHKLPDRDERVKGACEIPLDITPEEADKFRFVHVGGWQDGKVSGRKFSDFIAWRHPAEVRWMLGEFK